MTFIGSFKIDPKDYPFNKFINEQKHLDTDELRHTIKPIIHIIDKDFKGQEHLFCDRSQLCPLGKFRRPKKIVEAEEKGFASVAEMVNAEKQAVEDLTKKELEDLKKTKEALVQRNEVLEAHARKLEEDFIAYQKKTNERFDKIALLFESTSGR